MPRYESRIETFYRNYKLEVRQSIQPGDLVWVKVEGANIRGNPTTVNSKVIDVAGRFVGLVVLYRSENGNWFRVSSPNGKYGWISRECITKDYGDTLRWRGISGQESQKRAGIRPLSPSNFPIVGQM